MRVAKGQRGNMGKAGRRAGKMAVARGGAGHRLAVEIAGGVGRGRPDARWRVKLGRAIDRA
jgi:hypothetical protein